MNETDYFLDRLKPEIKTDGKCTTIMAYTRKQLRESIAKICKKHTFNPASTMLVTDKVDLTQAQRKKISQQQSRATVYTAVLVFA